MKNKITLIGIIIAIIIITGIVITALFGLNMSVIFGEHKQIDIQLGKEFDNNEVANLVKEVVSDKDVVVQKVELYEDMASISIRNITDEELQNLVTKINEKYSLEYTVDTIQVTNMPSIKLLDIVNPYVVPVIVSFVVILIYTIAYVMIKNKIGADIKLGKAILIILGTFAAVQGLYLAIFAIARIPVNNLTMPIFIIIYAYAMIKVMAYFEEKSLKIEK